MKAVGCGTLIDVPFQYCPGTGCTHIIMTKMLASVIDELGIREKTILVGPVGCSEVIIDYLNVDAIGAAHGRALAVATGVKRAHPDRVVLTYQGDGDFASIGISETIHTASRGEKISSIWINNGIYGMTGGQMSPTTLIGQRTTTTPAGRARELTGEPLNVSAILSQVKGACYISREAVNSKANLEHCRASVIKGIKLQMAGYGFNAIEVLGICPTNWHLSPKDCLKRLEQEVASEFPLQVYKDKSEGRR